MRLSDERIKQAILHPEVDIRQRAVRYFASSFSQDPSIMPFVIKAVETYGKEDAYHLIGLSTDLVQSNETVSWIIGQLKSRNPKSFSA
ncbi:MAG TPA: hypothetical protein VNA25_08780 [Phycisphaerae bacterium]|nr:hypothetical protein [Phycisphaerae bacterium]